MALASAATTGAAQRARKPYTYVRLRDLRIEGSPANVMGVVVLFKPPYQSRGRDHTCTLEIVDEGCETTPLPLIFFNRERGRLPRGVHVGDVVCVRRVELGEFNQRLQGKCQAHSSWLIWDCQQGGGGGGGGKPTLTSDGASWESQEIERARQLLTWSVSTRTDSQPSTSGIQPTAAAPVPVSPLRSSSLLLPITDITLTEHKINVVGVVKSVSLPQKSRGPDYFISVILIDESLASTGLPFTLFAPLEDQLPKLGDPGCVAYMTNIKVIEFEGNLLGCGHQRSRVDCFNLGPDGEMVSTGKSDVPSAVRDRAKFLLEWVATAKPVLVTVEDSQLPPESQPHTQTPPPPPPLTTVTTSSTKSSPVQTSSVFDPPVFQTVMFHPTWPINTLSDVLESPVLSCFRVRVKVLGVLQPLSLDDCCQLRCPQCKHLSSLSETNHSSGNNQVCDWCSVGNPEPIILRFMFSLSLLVNDSSSQTCTVHLTDTDAEEFFRDLSPDNLRENETTRRSLMKILTTLCGGVDPFQNRLEDPSVLVGDKSRPWIDCCIQTYPSSKGTQLRIVDTWFLNRDQRLS